MFAAGHLLTFYISILGTPKLLRLKPGEVVVTFDDGPNGGTTAHLLDLLEKWRCPAAFSIIGRQAREFPELVRRVHREGHTLVNHTMNHGTWHFSLSWQAGCGWGMSRAVLSQEIEACDREIGQALEVPDFQSRFFRPPFGIVTPVVRAGLKERNMRLAPLTFFALDFVKIGQTDKIAEKILATLRRQQGGVFVLHEKRFVAMPDGRTEMLGNIGNDRAWVPGALEKILEQLAREKFTFANPAAIFDR